MMTSIITFLKLLPKKSIELFKLLIEFLRDNSISIKIAKKTSSEVTREIEISNSFIVIVVLTIVGVIYFFIK